MIFKKHSDKLNINDFFRNVFDPQDFEVFIVRDRNCEVVFANAKATERANTEQGFADGCKTSFAKCFSDICSHCPYGEINTKSDTRAFEIEDKDNRTYAARCDTIAWIDGMPVSIFMMRDISSEKETKDRLYKLAYIDQLTGIPNRQKLKEDFSALKGRITDNRLSGIIALFDLDNFKTINDTYGHNTGDVVLSRLTDHLQEDKTFSGHLYRLGGDEFVFLFYDDPGRFASESEMKQHYNDLLSTALHAYTLPNIDLKCTLSMGVSLFPKHGDNLSETLRKADIALYKAKTGGRNQLAFFEDQYDTAQKFKDLYVNIQPVLLGTGKTFGYELIDRGSRGDEDDNTINLNEFNHTLDALGLHDIENKAHYFISYSKQLFDPAVLKNLPKEKFIVQIPVPANFKSDGRLICHELRKIGYRLALTGLDSGNPPSELLSLASYCKFSPTDADPAAQKKVIEANPKIRFIATRVDSQDDFQSAKDAGFQLYQGFFFQNPALNKKTKEVNPLRANFLHLLKLSGTNSYMDFHEISSVISSDVALSYKLLRVLNSAAVGLKNSVSSIANAVAYMGEENLKKWIAVLALGGIADDAPLELVRMSLIRARFGELLASHFRTPHNSQQIFMVGILSLLHIALEKSKEQLLEEIHVSDEIRESLLTRNGIYSDLLRFYENYEYANWELVSQFVEEHQLDPSFVNDAYIAAVKWYNDLTGAL